MKTEIHTDPSIFRRLAAEWSGLLATAKHNTIFATWEWADTWWRSFGAGRDLLLISLRDEQGLVGLVPLYGEQEDGRRLLRFVGGVDVTDYEDIVARPGSEHAVWDEALRVLGGLAWDELDLHNVPALSHTVTHLRSLQQPALGVSIATEDVCPIIQPLPADWETYLSSLDKKDRHELRRKLRRLTSNPDLGYGEVWEHSDLRKAMQDFARLHRLSSVDKAVFMTEHMEGFFQDLAAMCQERGWLSLGFMTVQGQPVSTTLAFDYGNGYYLYNSGYDPDYEYLSVGLLLKAVTIQRTIAAGKTCYDFLQGSERYKYDLGGKNTEVCHIHGVRTAS